MLTRTEAHSRVNDLYDIIEKGEITRDELSYGLSILDDSLTLWTTTQHRAASIRRAIEISKLATWKRKTLESGVVNYQAQSESGIDVTIYCSQLPPSCRIEKEEYTEDEPEMAATGRIIAVKKTRTKVICD